jgi:hypothetical protein
MSTFQLLRLGVRSQDTADVGLCNPFFLGYNPPPALLHSATINCCLRLVSAGTRQYSCIINIPFLGGGGGKGHTRVCRCLFLGDGPKSKGRRLLRISSGHRHAPGPDEVAEEGIPV